MKETVEHNNRFYKQPNGEILTESEQLKEWLIVANKENERLNNIINIFEEELKWQRKVSLSLNESFAVSRIDTLINILQELKGGRKQ